MLTFTFWPTRILLRTLGLNLAIGKWALSAPDTQYTPDGFPPCGLCFLAMAGEAMSRAAAQSTTSLVFMNCTLGISAIWRDTATLAIFG